MRTLSCMRGAVAAAILTIPAFVPAELKMEEPIAMLPADTQVAIAIDLTESANPKSILSIFPREEITQKLIAAHAKDAEKKKAGSGEASSAALKALVSKGNLMVIGLQNIDPTGGTEPTVYGIISGGFTKAEADSAIASFSDGQADDKGVSTITDQGGKTSYTFSPKDNLLLFSTKQDWLGSAWGNIDAKTGMASDASGFKSLTPALNGRNPDVAIYVDGKMISEQLAKNPGAGMMAAPLTSAKALGLMMFPAEAGPSMELQIPYADEGGAKMAQAWLTQLVGMGKGQMQQGIDSMASAGAPDNPEMAKAKAQATKSMEMLNKIEITQTGSIATAKIPIPMDLIPKDFNKTILDGIDQSMAAKDAKSNDGGGMMAPEPTVAAEPTMAEETPAPAMK
ncbi:hypothetical protein BH09SUM1_BH09SUM1_00360 [soil metagenome]